MSTSTTFDSTRGPMVNPHRPHGSCMRCLQAHTAPRGFAGRDYCDPCARLQQADQRDLDRANGECIVCQMPVDKGDKCGTCENLGL